MKLSKLVFILIIAFLVLAVLAVFFLLKPDFFVKKNPNVEPTPAPSPTPIRNIIVLSPKPNEIIYSVLKVTGEARVFENQLNVRITSEGENVYEEGVMANAAEIGEFGSFEKEISLLNLGLKPGFSFTLEVFDYSAKDGSEVDKVIIPLKVGIEEGLSVRVYFNNGNLDPEFSCNKVFPVEREIPRTQAVARAALEELLKGPDASEKSQGYITNINPGVKIKSLTIENGVAKVDFDEQLEFQVGGSCRVAAIRAEITQTLKQFATVKEIIISIEGRTEDILQP